MPRAKSESYRTIRIEMGVREREMAEAALSLGAIPVYAVGLGVVAAGVGIGAAGIGVYWASKKLYGWGEEAAAEIQDWIDNVGGVGVKEAVVGRAQYTDPTTGVTHNNPFAGVPVLGSLFGTGINLGIASWRATHR